MIDDPFFVSAVDLKEHPIKNIKQALKTQYYYALKHYVDSGNKSAHVKCRLERYEQFLLQNEKNIKDENACVNAIVSCRFQPWRNIYKFWLLCDLALIFDEHQPLKDAAEKMKGKTSRKQGKFIEQLLEILSSNECREIIPPFISASGLIEQYWKNTRFLAKPERKIIITANMSAGKSTLINALVGIDIARTSQEVCTGNICYFYNKAFDDGAIHFNGNNLNYSLTADSGKNFEWDSAVSFAIAFNCLEQDLGRLCLIDTPGVNSAIKREHGKIAKGCIASESYDRLLYVLNANKLGTDEEIAYLEWISNNVPVEKVIFVLNKLDTFKKSEDSILMSIEGVKGDLQKLGYNDPLVFPISAYFAYLIKKEAYGGDLSDDEKDEYLLYKKKFSKSEYNLSLFYENSNGGEDYEGLLKRSGLYYLEKKLYGGLT